MRGRLINPFLAEIAQLDTVATAADPDGAAGPLTSGYDPDFQEPARLPTPGGVQTPSTPDRGIDARKEKPAISLPCQVETDAFGAQQMLPAGNAPETTLALTFHFQDLERLGMVDPNGDATLRVSDRLVAIRRMDGALVQAIRTPPGLYATKVEPIAFGIGGERNLLTVQFGSREQAAR
jgi:hypothetical protein